MSCNTRYWHGMSCAAPERPSNQALAAENNKSLAALMAAREAQDKRWFNSDIMSESNALRSYAAEDSGEQSSLHSARPIYSAADQSAGSDQRTERKPSSK